VQILCYGIFFLNSTNKALDDLTGNKMEVEQINVYVAKDDPVDSINAAVDSGYIFGVIRNNDSEGVNKVIAQINSDIGQSITTAEFESVYDMAVAFELGQIKSIIVNTGMLELLESSEEYKGFSDKLRIILEEEIESEISVQANEKPFDKNRFCLYISGIDTFGSVNIKSRSDVNIIAVVNSETRTILLVSTPRDYYVEFPNLGNRRDKLTHAGVFGIDTSMSTLETAV
jgi:Cell envelope-related transcriptional attenuator domain.